MLASKNLAGTLILGFHPTRFTLVAMSGSGNLSWPRRAQTQVWGGYGERQDNQITPIRHHPFFGDTRGGWVAGLANLFDFSNCQLRNRPRLAHDGFAERNYSFG